MHINSLNTISFGKIYKGIGNQKLTRTQLDVIDDIEYKMENENYVKRLENIGYDVYIEPAKDNFAISLAFFKNARFSKNNKFVFDKVVNIGTFIADAGLRYRSNKNGCSIEQLDNMLRNFFKNESWGKYKRFVNYL